VSADNEQLELLAARIVASQTGCEFAQLDRKGGPSRLADFRLLDHKGSDVGLLEVTSVTDGPLLSTMSAIHGPKSKAKANLQGSRLWWSVTLNQDVRASSIRAVLDPVLQELETLYPFGRPEDATWMVIDRDMRGWVDNGLPEHINARLGELGVLQLIAQPVEGCAGSVNLAMVISTGPLRGLGVVTAAVNDALNKPDNLSKVRAANGRAELFVWLVRLEERLEGFHADPTHPAHLNLPDDAPTLPDGVTGVWAAPTPTLPDSGPVWWSDGGTWQVRTWTLPDGSMTASP